MALEHSNAEQEAATLTFPAISMVARIARVLVCGYLDGLVFFPPGRIYMLFETNSIIFEDTKKKERKKKR